MLICPYTKEKNTKEKTVPVPRRGEIMRDETKMDVYTSGVYGFARRMCQRNCRIH